MRKHILVLSVIPIFFSAFIIAYKPFDYPIFLEYGHFVPPVHMVLLSCILLATIFVSRFIYFVTEKISPVTWWQDLIWCFCEMFISSFFLAMYMSLSSHELYFECLGTMIQLVYSVLIYPYSILCLVESFVRTNGSGSQVPDKGNIIHFYDENKRLKLVVACSALLFIKADNNSVRINYLESGKHKVCILRISMVKLEPLAKKYGLVRCQRSYYVNPTHVKILRKGNDGLIFAHFEIEGVDPVPVSKTYYSNLADIL